jgi:hypothetical protein
MQDSLWMQTARFFIIVVPILMLITHVVAHLLDRLRAPADFPDVEFVDEVRLTPEIEKEFLSGPDAPDSRVEVKAFMDGRLTLEEFVEIQRRRRA